MKSNVKCFVTCMNNDGNACMRWGGYDKFYREQFHFVVNIR